MLTTPAPLSGGSSTDKFAAIQAAVVLVVEVDTQNRRLEKSWRQMFCMDFVKTIILTVVNMDIVSICQLS